MQGKSLKIALALIVSCLLGASLVLISSPNFSASLRIKVFPWTQQKKALPKVIETSRYDLVQNVNFIAVKGEYQLADTKDGFFALNRRTGELQKFLKNGNQEFKLSKTTAINIYRLLDLPTGLKPASEFTGNVLPLTFDIHVAFAKLFVSIVVPPSIENECEEMRMYGFNLNRQSEVIIKNYRLYFKTPCIMDRNNTIMWGGRMTSSSTALFLSIGDQRYDRSGFPKSDLVSKSEILNPQSVFGKVLKFSRNFSTFEIYTAGHRNGQGLFWSMETGALFEAEHGPFGGDEVNLLIRSKDYGWPFRTQGKPYPEHYPDGVPEINSSKNPSTGVDKKLGDFGAISGTHTGFEPPLFSWIPGVGAGNLVQVSMQNSLKDWLGNLIVALMGEKTLHRLVLSNDNSRVVTDERIEFGFRIRDLILKDDGTLILSTDEGLLAVYNLTM